MALLFAPVLFIAVVLYVALPLLKAEEQPEGPVDRGLTVREEDLAEKEEIIDSLRDIEMDFRMGKLSQEDYESLKADYERRAVAAFEKLQSHEPQHSSSDETPRS